MDSETMEENNNMGVDTTNEVGKIQHWEKVADCNCLGRSEASSFSLDGFGYIVGGSQKFPGGAHGETLRYSPEKNEWESINPLPVRKSMAIGFSNSNNGFICGGSNVSQGDYTTSEMFSLDKSTLSWSLIDSFPSFGFQSASSFKIDIYEYVLGGIYSIDG